MSNIKIKAAKATLLNIADGRIDPLEVSRDDMMDRMIANYFNAAAGPAADVAAKRLSIVTTGSSDADAVSFVRRAIEKHRAPAQ